MAPPSGAPPPALHPIFRVALAQDPAVTALYALVPSDAPVLLPLEIANEGVDTTSEPDVPILTTVPLTVADDPTGTVSAYKWLAWPSAELTWTTGVDREFGRSYTASLDVGTAITAPGQAQWYYMPSKFEFSRRAGPPPDFRQVAETAAPRTRQAGESSRENP